MPEKSPSILRTENTYSTLKRGSNCVLRTEDADKAMPRREFLVSPAWNVWTRPCLSGELLCLQDGRCSYAWQGRSEDQEGVDQSCARGESFCVFRMEDVAMPGRAEVKTRPCLRREFLYPQDGRCGLGHA
jgi:hypothetical protein